MKIHSLILHQHQVSILREEMSEDLVILLIEIDGVVGHIVGYHSSHKRDMKSEWFTTPELEEKVYGTTDGLCSDILSQLGVELDGAWASMMPLITNKTDGTYLIQRDCYKRVDIR